MQIHIDGKKVLELNNIKKNVIKNDLHEDNFQEDMERRAAWSLTHKYERCFERLKKEWEPKLKSAGIQAIPTDEDAFAELVFSQPGYKSKKQRDLTKS